MQLKDLPHMDKRIVVLDTTRNPAQILVSCLACNRLTDELECESLMCPKCDEMFGKKLSKEFVLPY
jgi:hypothetical protein